MQRMEAYRDAATRVEALERRVLALESGTGKSPGAEAEQLALHLAERMSSLLCRFGEYVDKTRAAQILGVSRATVYAMLADGRIHSACAGRYVDVRSIARYMEHAERMGGLRRGRKPGSRNKKTLQ